MSELGMDLSLDINAGPIGSGIVIGTIELSGQRLGLRGDKTWSQDCRATQPESTLSAPGRAASPI